MPPRYPLPWHIGVLLLRDALRLRHRSFSADARACVELLSPPPKILNSENIPQYGPALLVTNHYYRPGFKAWWIALAISAAVPQDVHWMMTSAWTFLGSLEPLSQWLFPRVARVYGFTPTPPMPPDPRDVEMRAHAVRSVLRVARQTPGVIIALAPEGRDNSGGVLGPLPPGVGRFIEKLMHTCQRILPIGVYEDANHFCLNFGLPFTLDLPQGLTPRERDRKVGQTVMQAIARQLPDQLRGEYRETSQFY
ncbi:MAG: hypothetical protein AB1345_01430 [Chloroflexota bacterium]